MRVRVASALLLLLLPEFHSSSFVEPSPLLPHIRAFNTSGTRRSPAQVLIHCPPPKNNPQPTEVTVQSNIAERRVWVQRGSGDQKQIIYSSTFDAVISGDTSPSELYAQVAEQAVAAAIEGKLGCVLCLGQASALKEVSLFSELFSQPSSGQLTIAAKCLCEMLARSKGQTVAISLIQVDVCPL